MDQTRDSLEKRGLLKGLYANTLRVGYNAFEFVFDFGQAFSESKHALSCMRIVTNPGHAKAMIKALQKALDAFEKDYGHIGSEWDAAAGRKEPERSNHQ